MDRPPACVRSAVAMVAALPSALAWAATAPDADEPSLPGFEWLAPPEICANREQIAADIATLLGTAAFDLAASSGERVTVRIEELRPGWRARVALYDAGGRSLGQRELRSREPGCRSLDGPVALVVAILLESVRPTPAPLELPAAPPRASPEADSAPEWQTQWHLSVVGSGGLLPGFALGAELGVGATPPRFAPIMVGVTIWPGAEKTEDGRGGSFSAWHAGLGICPTLASDAWGGVGLCVGAEGGMLMASGVGLDSVSSPRRPLVAARADARAWVAIGGPFIAHLQAGAAAPFVSPNYVYDGPDGQPIEVHKPWPVVPIGAVGLGVVMPP